MIIYVVLQNNFLHFLLHTLLLASWYVELMLFQIVLKNTILGYICGGVDMTKDNNFCLWKILPCLYLKYSGKVFLSDTLQGEGDGSGW